MEELSTGIGGYSEGDLAKSVPGVVVAVVQKRELACCKLLPHVRPLGEWKARIEFIPDGLNETATHAPTRDRRASERSKNERGTAGQVGRPTTSAPRVDRLLQGRPVNTASSAGAAICNSLPTVRRSITRIARMDLVRENMGMRRGRALIYTAYWHIVSHGVVALRQAQDAFGLLLQSSRDLMGLLCRRESRAAPEW